MAAVEAVARRVPLVGIALVGMPLVRTSVSRLNLRLRPNLSLKETHGWFKSLLQQKLQELAKFWLVNSFFTAATSQCCQLGWSRYN